MKKASLLFYSLFSAFSMPIFASNSVETVPSVDLQKYMGVWYEIARYPQYFEKDMTHVTATYTMMDDYVQVLNQGIKNGKKKSAKAKATVVPNSGNAKLKVQFFWPFKGDYWIIALDPEYKWAVVSGPKKSSLWILSRTPQMNLKVYADLIDWLVDIGYDPNKIEKTIQN